MRSIHTLAVIGGTGKAGRYLVKQLLLKNFRIKLLHRKPEILSLESPHIEVIKGDARDYNAIYTLLTGCDAVLSCLSQPVGEPSIFSDAARNILKAMHTVNISRYITIAGLNVDTPNDHKSAQTQFGTNWMYENYPATTKDRQVEYQLLADSKTDWTMIRLPLIDQTDDSRAITVSLVDCQGSSISATSLALFMIKALKNGEYIKQAPFIADV
ncbi:NAD(P)-dependent oxidoreductase [Mucilaginibacter sp. AK015]|uniref:NAD(P)-dependent oxidoreductase n=1 Tax=Mucilaginibacter sp. AK015 TaxID=2723072 RepID=UPI001613E752|nr:NAD(P)H-binding protein [Mucilaginibacter sp. AK015]MBB5394840.1 putative NADH-flavin reductase [Mucilaginibacter sp. AK015]